MDGEKLGTVEDEVLTTELLSLVSVRLAEVSTLIVTVPVGALLPVNVMGCVVVRSRLKTTML